MSSPVIGDWAEARVEGMVDKREGIPLPSREIILGRKGTDPPRWKINRFNFWAEKFEV